jgi:hypothetical protein
MRTEVAQVKMIRLSTRSSAAIFRGGGGPLRARGTMMAYSRSISSKIAEKLRDKVRTEKMMAKISLYNALVSVRGWT